MKQDKLTKDKKIGKRLGFSRGKTASRNSGLSEGINEWNRGRTIALVIANDCCLHCPAPLHGGGFDRHILFSCKCPFRGYLSNSLSTALLQSTSPSCSEAPPSDFFPYIHTFLLILCSDLTHFSLNYLFIYTYLSNREGPAWVKLKAVCTRSGGWSLSGSVCEHGGDHWTLKKLFKGQKIGSYLLNWTLPSAFWNRFLSMVPVLLMRRSFVLLRHLFMQVHIWQRERVLVRKCSNQGNPHTDPSYLTAASEGNLRSAQMSDS